ncbi:hypothetical protein PC129_g11462 [Phytophthora cactorum]|uniref:P-loop containing nucleoside triphosphate hydrolase n=1 Tax=Phytophthora cactorum TaxID=29920 RepID=A0A329S663_9STRA|nr:hypothetical protein Pcac1_g13120 [Phytophthora cactorum]KAG2828139.1 hypothetical protein PC112_g8575 [Phytophthora cactorum]KAG2829711.1 hypothetical protein PC111_g7658 [Phytophthora cactorum]KAG2859227.1 hypothetical protein PC113_g9116 [Phytophthora cactorum]KAG2900712.1 hypothetical protein PC114_g13456 [Phytophthora cactorum]
MNFSYFPRMNLVHDNLDLLDLTAILWAVVGGLYDEQKERVPGGVEMVGYPGILSRDELTSGLDTRSGLIMMCGVQSIARTGLLSTIHQPSISLFELFNGHLLLQRGGYTAYFGDLGVESDKMLDLSPRSPVRWRSIRSTILLRTSGMWLTLVSAVTSTTTRGVQEQ